MLPFTGLHLLARAQCIHIIWGWRLFVVGTGAGKARPTREGKREGRWRVCLRSLILQSRKLRLRQVK